MRRSLVLLTGCCIGLGLVACGDEEAAEREKEMQAAVESLVQAEKDFAATVKAEGIKAGFLSVLHPDGILFNPTPTNGVALYEAAPESEALLTWEPRYAELSSSLDLGYTTGPWEYFPSDTASEAVAFGDYFSIWKKDSAGVWKLVLDLGVSRSAPEPMHELKTKVLDERNRTVGSLTAPPPIRSADAEGLYPRDEYAMGLGKWENRFNAKRTYPTSEDIRVLRDGVPRMIGLDSTQAASLPVFTVREMGAAVSDAGDLGFVYGIAEGTISVPDGSDAEGIGGYVRVWRGWNREDKSNAGRIKPSGSVRPKGTDPSYKLAAEVMSLRPKQ